MVKARAALMRSTPLGHVLGHDASEQTHDVSCRIAVRSLFYELCAYRQTLSSLDAVVCRSPVVRAHGPGAQVRRLRQAPAHALRTRVGDECSAACPLVLGR